MNKPRRAMRKTFSKIVLSLMVFANINPVLAASKYQHEEFLQDKLDYQEVSGAMVVANFFDVIEKGIDTIEDINEAEQRRREDERRARERQAREAERQRAREERLRARQAREEERRRQRIAREEKAREEARRRQEYFNSLSPEEQQVYIKRQQEIKERQMEAAAAFFLLLIGSGGSSSPQGQTTQYGVYPDNNSSPTYNPAPAPVKPIHPNYGGCHHYSC